MGCRRRFRGFMGIIGFDFFFRFRLGGILGFVIALELLHK